MPLKMSVYSYIYEQNQNVAQFIDLSSSKKHAMKAFLNTYQLHACKSKTVITFDVAFEKFKEIESMHYKISKLISVVISANTA